MRPGPPRFAHWQARSLAWPVEGAADRPCEPRARGDLSPGCGVEVKCAFVTQLREGMRKPARVARPCVARGLAELDPIHIEHPGSRSISGGCDQHVSGIQVRMMRASVSERTEQCADRLRNSMPLSRIHGRGPRGWECHAMHASGDDVSSAEGACSGVHRIGKHVGRQDAGGAQAQRRLELSRGSRGRQKQVTRKRRKQATMPRVPHHNFGSIWKARAPCRVPSLHGLSAGLSCRPGMKRGAPKYGADQIVQIRAGDHQRATRGALPKAIRRFGRPRRWCR